MGNGDGSDNVVEDSKTELACDAKFHGSYRVHPVLQTSATNTQIRNLTDLSAAERAD